jgi:hypothetical protein
MTFNHTLLSIPEPLFDMMKDSVSVNVTEKNIAIKKFNVYTKNYTTGKYTLVSSEKYLQQTPTKSVNYTGMSLNTICSILSDYTYLGVIDGKHTFNRPEFIIANPLQGQDPVVPQDVITISDEGTMELFTQEPALDIRVDEYVKIPSGEWIVTEDYSVEELLNLKYCPETNVGIGQSNIPTLTQFKNFAKATLSQIKTALQIKRSFRDETNPAVVRHIFTACEKIGNTVVSEMFVNGKTDAEQAFGTYNKPNELMYWNPMKYQLRWEVYNEREMPADLTEAQKIAGYANMGSIGGFRCLPSDPKAKTVNVIEDVNFNGYNQTTNTFHYNPNKSAIICFAFHEFNTWGGTQNNGKEVRFEYYLNLNNGNGGTNMEDAR